MRLKVSNITYGIHLLTEPEKDDDEWPIPRHELPTTYVVDVARPPANSAIRQFLQKNLGNPVGYDIESFDVKEIKHFRSLRGNSRPNGQGMSPVWEVIKLID